MYLKLVGGVGGGEGKVSVEGCSRRPDQSAVRKKEHPNSTVALALVRGAQVSQAQGKSMGELPSHHLSATGWPGCGGDALFCSRLLSPCYLQ